MIRKLKFKFVMINMAMVTVMLCIIFGLVYNSTKTNLETQSISMMHTIATDPFRQGRPNEPSPDLKLPYFTLLLNKQGDLLSTGGGYYDLSDQVFLHDLISQSLNGQEEVGVLKDHNLRFCRVITPVGTVLVFADMSSENNTLNSLVRTCSFIGIFAFLVFLGISIFLSRRAVQPVEEAWLQQKQFVADAAHELKTPLTVIMTNAELLQSEDCPEPEQTAFSQRILIMSRQMKELVERMLELARSDVQPQMAPVDLSRLLMDAALSFEGLFIERNLTLESVVEPDVVVWGHAPSLQQVADILLDNARKYAASGSQTVIGLHSLGLNRCILRVSSPGEEIPHEELKKIFQRFYRMDKARNRDGSFGLGLSIAENIVVRHKGRIWAESRDGVNTFFVELVKYT